MDKYHNKKGERTKAERFEPGSKFTVVPSSKSKALAKKAGSKRQSLPHNVKAALNTSVPEHLKNKISKDKYGTITYKHD